MKHLTRIIDLSTEEITSILNLADNLKVQFKNYNFVPYLDGLTLGMIFEKAPPGRESPLKPACTTWAARPSS